MKEHTRDVRLGQILGECAAESIPDNLDLWPSLRARLHAQHRRHDRRGLTEDTGTRRRFLPAWGLPRRVGTIAASLLLVLALVGATYAVVPALNRLFEAHTGTEAIISDGLGREVNASRTVDGFTVIVKHVYADPNQIVIGLVVSGPPGRTFNNIQTWAEFRDGGRTWQVQPILTDHQGHSFSGGLGGTQGGVEDGAAAVLLTYNGSGIEAGQREIDVQLVIGALRAYERLGDNEFRDVIVEGPFTFDLTIPVEAGRMVELHQTVESGGTEVTLERMVTTPTGTRVSLRGAGPNADVRLTVEGVTYQLHSPDGLAWPVTWAADSQWDYVTGTSLQDKRGEWVLTVRPGASADPSATQVEGGPWTFRFTVPVTPG